MDVGLIILAASALSVAAILAGAAGQRIGAPLLLVFLLMGMLAGREGPGGLSLDVDATTLVWASAALAIILFEGGLRTSTATFRLGAKPGLILALPGTVVTAALLAPVAQAAFGLGWGPALLIGAVVSATDAAAVFALAATGAKLPARVVATLEVESGNNDPIAILMVAGIAIALAGEPLSPTGWVMFIIAKLGVGVVIGVAFGWAAPTILRRAGLPSGLRTILAVSLGLVAFGLAETLGGSGFAAIYLTGLVFRARAPKDAAMAADTIDGLAWLAQTGLFLILGLLITPTHLASVTAPSLALFLALAFLARPLVVGGVLTVFRFPWRETAFVAWTGLRGATPVFLGVLPAVMGVPNANLYLSVAAAVVLLSLVLQGWTAPMLARALGLGGAAHASLSRHAIMARLAAMGVALSVGATLTASAPDTGGLVGVQPETVDGLRAALRNAVETPITFPPDFPDTPLEARRPLFVETVRMAMEAANADVRAHRDFLQRTQRALDANGRLTLDQEARVDAIARRYGLAYESPAALLERLDVVPPRLAVAQAALTTGWGGAATALRRNTVFGVAPRGGYADLPDAARGLIALYAGHGEFQDLRRQRAQLQAQNREVTAEDLAPFIAPLVADSAAYVEQIRVMLASDSMRAPDGQTPPASGAADIGP